MSAAVSIPSNAEIQPVITPELAFPSDQIELIAAGNIVSGSLLPECKGHCANLTAQARALSDAPVDLHAKAAQRTEVRDLRARFSIHA